MSDRMPCALTVGGRISRDVFKKLLERAAACTEGLGDDQEKIDPEELSRPDALAAVLKEHSAVTFTDCEAAYGEFPELENFCQEYKIAYDRQTIGHYEYSSELVTYRPDLAIGVLTYETTQDCGDVVIRLAELREALDNAAGSDLALTAVRALLDTHTPAELPPLEVYDA
jgi:hypothetical protein